MVFIPQGGTIRNSVEWEAYIDSDISWYIHTLYGKTVGEDFNIYLSGYVIFINPPKGIHNSNIDITIPIDAVSDTYDAWTVIADGSDISTANILAEKYDVGVLEVVPTILAEIISTNFTQI